MKIFLFGGCRERNGSGNPFFWWRRVAHPWAPKKSLGTYSPTRPDFSGSGFRPNYMPKNECVIAVIRRVAIFLALLEIYPDTFDLKTDFRLGQNQKRL